MTELSFSRQFLSNLASRSVRIPSDFCEDPRKLPSRNPYTLPPNNKPKAKRARLASDSTDIPTANVTIKSLRGAAISHSIPGTPLSSTILTLKHSLSTATKIPIDKLKLLLKGKVLTDLKTLQELGIEEGSEVGLSVMAMGGATPAVPAVAQGGVKVGEEDLLGEEVTTKKSVLKDEKFWEELRGFLKERLGNGSEEDPGLVLATFKDSWAKRSL